MCAKTMPLLRSVEVSVETLEAMDESAVARKSVEIIRQYLREFKASRAPQPAPGANGSEEMAATEPGTSSGFEIPEWAYCFYSALLMESRGCLRILEGCRC